MPPVVQAGERVERRLRLEPRLRQPALLHLALEGEAAQALDLRVLAGGLDQVLDPEAGEPGSGLLVHLRLLELVEELVVLERTGGVPALLVDLRQQQVALVLLDGPAALLGHPEGSTASPREPRPGTLA